MHVALSSGPSPRGANYNPRVELIAKGYKFYIGLYSEIFLLLKIRTMATNFSPCKGSYVLNQFPSNVMFGMNGFHVSASGAIQGHHGPLVLPYPGRDQPLIMSIKDFVASFIQFYDALSASQLLLLPIDLLDADFRKHCKNLNIYQTTKFRLVQIETFCRR